MRRGPDPAARPLSAYVYAFVSGPPSSATLMRRSIEVVAVGGVHAALEWRQAAFAATAAVLRRQHAVVSGLARRHDAVVPARFGSLLEMNELRRLVRARSKDLRTALALVRGRTQMTVRIPLPKEPRGARARASGTEYLNRRRPAVAIRRSAEASAVHSSVRALVVRERVDVLSAEHLSMFHLIDRKDVGAYRAAVAEALDDRSKVIVSGPFPPFAFAPNLWS